MCGVYLGFTAILEDRRNGNSELFRTFLFLAISFAFSQHFTALIEFLLHSIMEAKGGTPMRKQRHYVYLNEQETRVLLKSLIRFKNTLAQQGRYTDVIDELIMKVVSAPIQRV